MTATHQLCLATERSCQLLSSSFPCPCPCAVLVCCESYKFHERVQLDAITHNELMDQEQLAKVGCRGWRGGVGWGGWESSSRVGTGSTVARGTLGRLPTQFPLSPLRCGAYANVPSQHPPPHLRLLQVQDRPDVPALEGWREEPKVQLLNLAYDLTPAGASWWWDHDVGLFPRCTLSPPLNSCSSVRACCLHSSLSTASFCNQRLQRTLTNA